ncbi:hypothetical protein MAR_023276 [Mya arenaria]|uniref:Uncharacterized protein n=1 Tax=Mya arenaria TaxID=6604 RepID=A0ABY7DPU9_MYAAR|nr:hypothetical protein MAR_023276 [Mya arenaria]
MDIFDYDTEHYFLYADFSVCDEEASAASYAQMILVSKLEFMFTKCAINLVLYMMFGSKIRADPKSLFDPLTMFSRNKNNSRGIIMQHNFWFPYVSLSSEFNT